MVNGREMSSIGEITRAVGGPELTSYILAHELGHQFGLHHTGTDPVTGDLLPQWRTNPMYAPTFGTYLMFSDLLRMTAKNLLPWEKEKLLAMKKVP